MLEEMRLELKRLRLLIWCLAAFHVSALTLVLVIVLYLSDDLADRLDDLGTLPGLGIFAFIWFAAWLGTRAALVLDGAILMPVRFLHEFRFASQGIMGGALSGAVIFVGLAIALLVTNAEINELGPSLIGLLAVLLVVVPIGAFVAAVFGSLFGLVFGLVDGLLLAAALAVIGGERVNQIVPQEGTSPASGSDSGTA